MRFWDSSAIVPLLVEEAWSRACRSLVRADRGVVVWCLTRTEVRSALWRRHQEARLTAELLLRAQHRLDDLAAAWHEVDGLLPVRDEAERLLQVHSLTATDALQLGAALIAAEGRPRRRAFVTLDERLLDAARREGFEAIAPAG